MNKKTWIVIAVIAFTAGAIFYFVKTAMEKQIAAKEAMPKVAIVIDDWGYNMNNAGLFESIDIPLTISILPNLTFSEEIAGRAYKLKNREVLLHLPMQPQSDRIRLEKETLLVSMDRDEAEALIDNALESVRYAKGVSNHMGSKATEDKELMDVVMRKLKKGNLYFLDSAATPDSVCKKSATDYGVGFVKRKVFLDNISDRGYISSQFDLLIKRARQEGSAVGIGHDRRLTLEVIDEKSKSSENDDINFVFVSKLVK